ncbi:putative glycoside hydrolase [Amycolatopsis thermoflava]|uniref:putative glycoside hydrolase n=1 Tax=Amycolatopsis thermoflava TaxID=84480 RepID=UPI003EC0D498
MGRHRTRSQNSILVLVAIIATMAVAVTPAVVQSLPFGLAIQGLGDDVTTNAESLRDIRVLAARDSDLDRVAVTLDDQPVTTKRDGGRLVLPPLKIGDGEHTLAARLPNEVPGLPDAVVTRTFTVDNTAPELSFQPIEISDPRKPVTLRGMAKGAEKVTVQGEEVKVNEFGNFTATIPTPPAKIEIGAQDAAGNRAAGRVPVRARHPGMRGVHMTAVAWTAPALREPVLQMARDGLIDTVQLDIKDESGEVGYNSQVPLAKEIGAAKNYYDLRGVVEQLHKEGIRVVGRLVAFRDPVLARASWESGKRDRVVQSADGQPWASGYGEYAFTNFANREVREYNIALATEAARAGFDDILYDYVRRPEGPIEQLRFPGLEGTPEEGIVDFLAESRNAVRAEGAYLGASVFGIAVNRPTQIGQDITAMARKVDYIAPMIYPSHWGSGEYGVSDPESQPLEITQRSLAAFAEKAAGTQTVIIPWIQAFSMSVHYGRDQIRAQLDGARANGMDSFLLWNASCKYNAADLAP